MNMPNTTGTASVKTVRTIGPEVMASLYLLRVRMIQVDGDTTWLQDMLDLISRLGGYGINVLFSSHVLPDIERTCDWVLMLDGGTVIRSGPLDQLVENEIASVEIIGDVEAVATALRNAGAVVETEGALLSVTSSQANPYLLIRDALADTGAGMLSLGPRETSLEDVFLGQGNTP